LRAALLFFLHSHPASLQFVKYIITSKTRYVNLAAWKCGKTRTMTPSFPPTQHCCRADARVPAQQHRIVGDNRSLCARGLARAAPLGVPRFPFALEMQPPVLGPQRPPAAYHPPPFTTRQSRSATISPGRALLEFQQPGSPAHRVLIHRQSFAPCQRIGSVRQAGQRQPASPYSASIRQEQPANLAYAYWHPVQRREALLAKWVPGRAVSKRSRFGNPRGKNTLKHGVADRPPPAPPSPGQPRTPPRALPSCRG